MLKEKFIKWLRTEDGDTAFRTIVSVLMTAGMWGILCLVVSAAALLLVGIIAAPVLAVLIADKIELRM